MPLNNSVDALRTHKTYDLDDDRKIARRERRYKIISDSLKIIEEASPLLTELIDRAEKDPQKEIIEIASVLSKAIHQARHNLEPYSAIPADAPTQCRCKTTDMHCLPEEFAKQVVRV